MIRLQCSELCIHLVVRRKRQECDATAPVRKDVIKSVDVGALGKSVEKDELRNPSQDHRILKLLGEEEVQMIGA